MKAQHTFQSAGLVGNLAAGALLAILLWLGPARAGAEMAAPAWTQRYSGPGHSESSANAVAADASGNAYVTGYSYGVGSGSDYVTIKYSSAGAPLWTNRYNGPGNWNDSAHAVTVDAGGNVLVTGASASTNAEPSREDYATIKYSSAGVPLWTNRYNGPINNYDFAQALAVDAGGNVYVTGASLGSGSGYDYATIKYSSAGAPLWTNRYNGPGNRDDYAQSVAVDAGGNAYVSGYSSGSGSGYDYATIKYSAAGVPLWTNRYNGPGNGDDQAWALAVDASGNALVAGYSYGGGSSGNDYATLKYSSAGVALWTNRYSGPGNGVDYAQAAAVDAGGNVFVTGHSDGGGYNYDYVTIKYSSAGAPLWTNRYDQPGSWYDYAQAVTVDASGNAYVAGHSYGGSSGYDYTTIKYSSAGVPLWTNRFNGPANGDDLPQTKFCLAVGPGGAVYVTGASDGDPSSSTVYDFTTVKYVIVPIITNTVLAGASLVSGGTGGPGGTYCVLASTNVAARAADWVRLATNAFGPDGRFSMTNAVDPAKPKRFFRLQVD